MGKITVLRVPVTGPAQVLRVPNTIDSFQALVGGLIEGVQLPTGHHLYCNEEGKLHGLPVNRTVRAGAPGYTYSETIVGDFVVVGETDDEGNDTSLTKDGIEQVRQHLNLRVVVPLGETPDERLRSAARAVLAKWEHGDLAGAVNELSAALDAADADEED